MQEAFHGGYTNGRQHKERPKKIRNSRIVYGLFAMEGDSSTGRSCKFGITSLKVAGMCQRGEVKLDGWLDALHELGPVP